MNSNIQNKNSMAAFLMNDNLEPATMTLDFVRLVFHFCNFVNLTLGGIAFGVGIGYDLTPINVSGSAAMTPVQTKFVITGVFVIIHGLIGAYGFVSKQSRSLIVYGCLGFCLLIVGSVAAWSAITGEENIIRDSRDHFYFKWKNFDEKIDKFVGEHKMTRVVHSDCECRYSPTDTDVPEAVRDHIVDCWSAKEGIAPTPKDEDNPLDKDDQYIWNLICIQKSCHMRYIPVNIDKDEANFTKKIDDYEDQKYYNCKEEKVCTDENSCDTRCDPFLTTYDKTMCSDLCNVHSEPYTCIRFVAILTGYRVVTMYVILFCLSVTQTVCLLCDILFIFWSLKEEVDIEIHQTDGKDGKRLSTKIQLLNRFLPCCFGIPTPDNNRQSNVALSDIFSASDPDSSQINAITDSDPSDPKT
ncbi:uncharacterized protein LOC134826452 isoform X2 [Bolinopsis microptera]|uniref:uncharacterized protein LOC134826452 isoform X2 n=1 Tax=Bolinopsis microptera TaxID=2820187 RepID=UPI003079F734